MDGCFTISNPYPADCEKNVYQSCQLFKGRKYV